MKTPYPGCYESFDSWNARCRAQERRQRGEDEGRYKTARDGRGLTRRQKERLARAEDKLPEGWNYWVCNDNRQLGLANEDDGYAGVATKAGSHISGQVSHGGVEGAKLALLLNRACAAVWGQQPIWCGVFTSEEWAQASESARVDSELASR